MTQTDRDRAFEEVRRCLAEADAAFARASVQEDERERLRLIDEAEVWLVRAERRLGRLADRAPSHTRPDVAPLEHRSFADGRASSRSLVWRRLPKG